MSDSKSIYDGVKAELLSATVSGRVKWSRIEGGHSFHAGYKTEIGDHEVRLHAGTAHPFLVVKSPEVPAGEQWPGSVYLRDLWNAVEERAANV